MNPTRMSDRRHGWRIALSLAVLAVLAFAPTSAAAPSAGATVADRPGPGMRDLAEARGIRFGTAVGSEQLADPAYTSVLASEFDLIVSENHMKWGPIHPGPTTYNFAEADAEVAFAEAHGMAVRGHNLAWYSQNPTWLTSGTWTPSEADALLRGHIDSVAGHYAGRLAQWDVVNEGVAANGSGRSYLWSQLLGYPGYIDTAFHQAHQADPAAALYYNDFGIERPGRKFDGVLALVRAMQTRNVPIDGVGFQSHLSLQHCTARCTNDFLRNMLAIDALGLDVAVTELDVAIPEPTTPAKLADQATVYRAVLAACLLAPNCHTFVMWGISDAYSWIPAFRPGSGAALPLDEQYRAKPAWTAMHDLLTTPPTAPSCADHVTRADAQAALEAGGEGAPLLDPDGDGIACPDLPISAPSPTTTTAPTTTTVTAPPPPTSTNTVGPALPAAAPATAVASDPMLAG